MNVLPDKLNSSKIIYTFYCRAIQEIPKLYSDIMAGIRDKQTDMDELSKKLDSFLSWVTAASLSEQGL